MQLKLRAKSYEMNMTEGPILKKLIRYSLPLIGTNLLQILFNSADVVVLGKMVDAYAMGAVGSTSSLINLLLGLFVGLSSGASVIVSRRMGAKDEEGAHKAVGTAIFLSLICSAILLVVGVTCSRYFLQWMDTDPVLIDGATRYMQIYFLGIPIILLYNFIASILRAVGDTFRPLLYLLIGGVVNVGLNVFCIKVLHLTVEGVAIATVASQLLSVILSLIALFKSKGYGRLILKYVKPDKKQLKDILKIGLPAGLQGMLFSLSNVVIQSNINAFKAETIAGNTAAAQLDSLIYTLGNALSLSCMAFVSQNYGCGKIDRIKKVLLTSIGLSTVVTLSFGMLIYLLADPLLSLFVDVPAVKEYAKIRLLVMCTTYFMCSIMECFSYTMRSLGKSISAMIISLVGACGFRLLWVNTFFLLNPTRFMLYLAWPVSWVLTISIYLCCVLPMLSKLSKKMKEDSAQDNIEKI